MIKTIDWGFLGAWILLLLFCAGFYLGVFELVAWIAT